MTVTLPSWIIPTAITVVIFTIAYVRTSRMSGGGDYDFGKGIMGFIWFLVSIIVSLIAWLIWAICA